MPGAPLPRRAVLGAYVDAYAAVVILREVGPQLEQYAAALASSPVEANQQMAREVQVALSRMREVVRQLGERRRGLPSSAASPVTSASGSAEVAARGSSAGSEMSSSEVAARLNVSSRHVRGLCCSGRLAATRRGRAWWVTQQALDDYLDGMEAAG